MKTHLITFTDADKALVNQQRNDPMAWSSSESQANQQVRRTIVELAHAIEVAAANQDDEDAARLMRALTHIMQA